jgi:hypothetical protein
MNALKKAVKTLLCGTVLAAMLLPSVQQLAEAKGKSHHHHHSSSSRGRSYSGSSGSQFIMTPYGPMRRNQLNRPQLQFTGQPPGQF